MVQREVLLLAGVGLTIGMVAAWGAMSSIRSFVFGMRAADSIAMIAAIGILMASANVAGFAPAARASRVDASTALRHE
jgi:ABC-type antimicrobial peptide transport system permease subunit